MTSVAGHDDAAGAHHVAGADDVVTLADPRVAVLVPSAIRTTAVAVARLDAQLASGLAGQREPMLGQIRIAWWREALAGTGAAAPADPVLTDLIAGGGAALVPPLLDAWEAVVVAPDAATLRQSAAGRGAALFAITATLAGWPQPDERAGEDWGCVSLALWWNRHDLLPDPTGRRAGATGRALVALDQWARVVARAQGRRQPLREGWSLMTAAFARG